MRAHVALTPADLSTDDLRGWSTVVVDVFRASTTVVTALANGCRMFIPVLTPEEARARAGDFTRGEVLLGGERGGEPVAGFDLGNSPLEYTPERVKDKVVIFTTTNGTRALAAAATAAATAVGALVNVDAVARWAVAQGRDLTVVCSGESGSLSLEDTVCAGLLVEALAETGGSPEMSDAARACRIVAVHYRHQLGRLLAHSAWARELARLGRGEDLSACLALNVYADVPILERGVVTLGPPGGSRCAVTGGGFLDIPKAGAA